MVADKMEREGLRPHKSHCFSGGAPTLTCRTHNTPGSLKVNSLTRHFLPALGGETTLVTCIRGSLTPRPVPMPLTAKQQRALARAPPNQRKAMRANFNRQDQSNGKSSNGNGKSRAAVRALAQGVGSVPRGGIVRLSKGLPIQGLDATHAYHLGLPRAVGPYTVLKTTQLIQTSSQVAFFGTFLSEGMTTSNEQWLPICGMGEAVAGPINTAAGTFAYEMDGMDSFQYAATATPAAITIQVMNPEPLQTTTGILYIGRSTAQYEIGGTTRTWNTLGNEFVQFMAPRMCSAGKLALRGVKVSSYPLDMSELANFRGIRPYADAFGTGPTFNWTSQKIRPAGFAPLVIYNPNGVGLQVLCTIEWRVRFDPGNVAAGTHTQHPITPDGVWNGLTSTMSQTNGVVDLAERTVETGLADAAVAAGAIALAG